jgi:hypothetical protein
MWAGYRLCAGIFQEDGMAAILAFFSEARISWMIERSLGRSPYVDRALIAIRIDCSTPPFVWVSEIRLIFENDFLSVFFCRFFFRPQGEKRTCKRRNL